LRGFNHGAIKGNADTNDRYFVFHTNLSLYSTWMIDRVAALKTNLAQIVSAPYEPPTWITRWTYHTAYVRKTVIGSLKQTARITANQGEISSRWIKFSGARIDSSGRKAALFAKTRPARFI
jgi:hypothetical protein